MQVEKITCGRTKNLGNFESLRMDVTAQLEEGEDPTEAMISLHDYVETLVNLDIDEIRIAKETD